MHLFFGLWRRIGLVFLGVGIVLSPQAADALRLVWARGDGLVADYRLNFLAPADYERELALALEAGDGDMARSIIALAETRNVGLSGELRARVSALPALDMGNVVAQGWNCVVNGDFDSEGGFACVVATDLTAVGDLRDLAQQGGNYLAGQPVNYFTLGLASVGLTLSAATVGTGGAALPLRAGASFLKAMNKVGKLPPKLATELGSLLAKSLNRSALDEALVLARELKFGDVGRPLGRLFDPKSVSRLTDLASDFGRIGKAGGVRAMKASAELADSARDVKVLAKAADKYQTGFPAVLKLLGKGVVRLVDLVATLLGWLGAAIAWIFLAVSAMLRASRSTAKFCGRLVRRPA